MGSIISHIEDKFEENEWKKQQTPNPKPRTKNTEQRTQNTEQRTKNPEQRTKNTEQTINILGLGPSIENYKPQAGQLSIGVNDIARHFYPDFLLVTDKIEEHDKKKTIQTAGPY